MTTAADIRAKSADELKDLERDLRLELFKARIQNHTNQLDSSARLRSLRRDIARIHTVQRQREIEAAKGAQS
jgi:large subunit ribosomal protein L29